ncbi:MAG: DUF4276 family protein [Chloroflexota bacterium]
MSKIVLYVEGDTEVALKKHLKAFLDERAETEGKPKVTLETRKLVTRKADKLHRDVKRELRRRDVLGVVGLIDVFPNFKNAEEAKRHLRRAVGDEPNFYPHAAQYDVEAWLLPFWNDICRRIGVRQSSPGSKPETVNGMNPPAYRLTNLYKRAKKPKRDYKKAIEMAAILKGKDLAVAAESCPELKAFLNTLLRLNGLRLLV